MTDTANNLPGKWSNVLLISAAELLAVSLWLSGSAIVPQLIAEWGLSPSQQTWMTMSVQIGFVVGALLSAIFNIADRIAPPRLIALSALLGALSTSLIPWLNPGPAITIGLRFLTGMFLAGVYPPGMKLISSWTQKQRGLGIGILGSALTVGSALPHLFNALPIFGSGGMPPWRGVLYASAGFAMSGAIISGLFVKMGPHLTASAPFNWRFAMEVLKHKPTRLANFGYLGHMWELYAMWTWVPILLLFSYKEAGLSVTSARLAGFAIIAAGALSSIPAGSLADRLGRTRITAVSLAISGLCAVLIGFFIDNPPLLTTVALIWGLFIVPDSAQFSTAVSELTDPLYVGTALTLQTSMGFLLTLFTIRIIPPLVDLIGWEWAFAVLALGPVFGITSMLRLRALPEAERMASGNR